MFHEPQDQNVALVTLQPVETTPHQRAELRFGDPGQGPASLCCEPFHRLRRRRGGIAVRLLGYSGDPRTGAQEVVAGLQSRCAEEPHQDRSVPTVAWLELPDLLQCDGPHVGHQVLDIVPGTATAQPQPHLRLDERVKM